MDEQLKQSALDFQSFPFRENSGCPYQASGHPARSGRWPTRQAWRAPCLEIEKDPLAAYKYTARGNLVAVVSNGTAVLGLGNIGALAGKPVWKARAFCLKNSPGLMCSISKSMS